jgi:hypothetical protein
MPDLQSLGCRQRFLLALKLAEQLVGDTAAGSLYENSRKGVDLFLVTRSSLCGGCSKKVLMAICRNTCP